MKKMTSRERVIAAARCEPVDRVPLMLWIEPHTTLKIAREVMRLRRAWERAAFDGLAWLRDNAPVEDVRNGAPLAAHLFQADFLRELGADIVDFFWGFYPLWIKKLRMSDGRLFFTDMYGVERGMGGLYMEAVDNPLKTREDVERYRFPDMSNPIHYAHIALYRRLHPDVAVAVACPGVQDWSQSWFGLEGLYTGLIDYPDTMERFFTRLAEHTLQIIRGAIRAGADLILIGDDYGSQLSLMMSKNMWVRFIFPQLKMQCDEIHRLGAPAFLHSCGFVAPLLDKIVEAGVDMLHPFQPVPGNDFAAAKAEYGGRLCFVTGIDVQRLPTMTPDEVRESILERARIAAPGGGFILCPTNFIQEDTPVENLKAMFETIKKVRGAGCEVRGNTKDQH